MAADSPDLGVDLSLTLPLVVEAIERWQESYGGVESAPVSAVDAEAWRKTLDQFLVRLTDEQYPFFHPHYAGQMLKPPHPVAVVGYLAAMLINPNNHALDGGPSTAAMEKECVERLAAMFGMNQHLGHLTSSGTIANLEALWVGREEKPGSVIAVSRDAHYTHARMGNVLGVEVIDVDVDDAGRMAVDDLARVLETHNVGTVVVTLGTTGIGAIDPLDDIIPVARAAELIRWSSIHTSTGFSRMAAGRFCLLIPVSAPTMRTSPRTPTSPATNFTLGRSRWSAHGLGPPRQRSGSPPRYSR
ncbi:MAG: aminotransferase class V-fold PLP-dependent enzyme [Actinomycetota bacterium]